MEARELRIGSIVYAEDETLHMTTQCKILEIKEKEVLWESVHPSTKGYRQADYFIDLEPIPLTEDILLRAKGFKKDRNGFCLENKMSLSFTTTKDGEYLACWLDRSLGITVQYLHQLQNLYFALTGEELEVNL